MSTNGNKRANEEGPSSSPPLKRQKINAASTSTAVSTDEMAARIRQLEQRLQQQEEENNQRFQLQEEQNNQRFQLQEEQNNHRIQLQEAENNQRLRALHGSMRAGMRRCGLSFNGKTTDVTIIDNLTRLSPLAVHYNANVTNQFIRDIPDMLWWQKILRPFLNLTDLSILRRTNTFFQSYWVSVLAQNTIRVPQGCPTLEKAMALAEIFAVRKEYTEADPLKITMEEGVHEILGSTHKMMPVTCSHITFVGKGKHQTTIRGGFNVDNRQHHVKFEALAVANPNGHGFYFSLNTHVDVLRCAAKKCGRGGMYVFGGATVTATQCEFMENDGNGVYCGGANTKVRLYDCTVHHNGSDGLVADDYAVLDLHGTKTDIHSNKGDGIWALDRGKVNIHLPSQHNTSHDNVGDDRNQYGGGSIANVNADGTFTHVVVDDDDDN